MASFILPTPTAEQRNNFRNLYFDVAWFGVLSGSAISFLSVYAARLGASSFAIGLLSAGPAVINLLLTLPAGRWLEGRPIIRSSFVSSVWHRLGYVALVGLPWLMVAAFQAEQTIQDGASLPGWLAWLTSGSAQIWGIIAITLAMSLPGTILAISFNAMFADVVPPEWRGHVVGRRNALIAITSTLTALLSGQILDRIIFPHNYQIVFILGAIGAMMSSFHLGRLRSLAAPPPRVGKPLGDLAQPGIARWLDSFRSAIGLRFLARSGGKPLLRLDLLRGPFGPLMAAYLVFYTFQFTSLPLFPLYSVRVLNLSDGAISLGNALFNVFIMLGSLRMSAVSRRFGNRRVLLWGMLLFGQYPVLLGLARDPTIYWIASVTGGLVWALLNVGLVNRLMERVPDDDRPAHMALHNLALNIGILVGSFLGPALGDWLGLRTALFISAGLRLLAGGLFWVLDREKKIENGGI